MPVKVISCHHIMWFNSVSPSITACWFEVYGFSGRRPMCQRKAPILLLLQTTPLLDYHWWAKWNSYIWLESGPAGIWLELMLSSWFTKTAMCCISLFGLHRSLVERSCRCSSRAEDRTQGKGRANLWTWVLYLFRQNISEQTYKTEGETKLVVNSSDVVPRKK